MASSYALPPPPGGSNSHSHSHAHSHSYSHSSTSSTASTSAPGSSLLPVLPTGNGHVDVKRAVSHGSLYTHKESSRETSPLTSPSREVNNPIAAALAQNDAAARANGSLNGNTHEPSHQHHAHHSHHHSHTHSHHHSHHHSHFEPMKSRARGESDLGRPASAYQTAVRIPVSASWFSLPEALTSLLIPLPYMLASAAYGTGASFDNDGLPPLSPYARLQKEVFDEGKPEEQGLEKTGSAFVDACTLASGTLLLVGILAKIQASERMVERRKNKVDISQSAGDLLSPASLSKAATRALAVGLPFYAATQLGGMRTGLFLLVALTSGLVNSDSTIRPSFHDWKQILSSRIGTISVMLSAILLDFAGVTFNAPSTDLLFGYLALACSIFVLPLPLPALGAPSTSNPASPIASRPPWAQPTASSPMVSSVADVNITLVAGAALSVLTIISSFILSTSPPISLSALSFSTLSMASCAAAIIFAQPNTLRTRQKAGLGFSCVMIASFAFLFSPSLWPGTILNGGLSGLSFFGVLYDTSSATAHKHHDDHAHEHAHNVQSHTEGKHSAFTTFLIQRCERDSLLYTILSEKDSRRIAYFTCLNFGFMFVQGVYGWASGSLGLLSDTVHMLFDCLGLVVGLGAAVASKWPTTPEWPYGWGKLNTLAGFGNGIFLILVSFEFVWEALEGMAEGHELRHVQELMVVSVLGFLVNMVGLFAFGHAHAGHDHGHGHSHDHTHGHSHDHSHDHSHAHGQDCTHSHTPSPAAHSHDHNENMHGIFLHVAADAGGSAAVIISTALTIWRPWYLWDPLATILIAVLIFAAAIPLVTSSGRKLLLVIPDELEYNIKNTLQELGELRGVVGYAVPRFWLDDREEGGEDAHGHDHGHAPASGHTKVMGVIHIIANPAADVEDVRVRVDEFVRERNMDLVVHVEREGEGGCWCGGHGNGN